jgi:serine phosphatase RsbU (regulator of sigma subunit)/PAS domain-containing protein
MEVSGPVFGENSAVSQEDASCVLNQEVNLLARSVGAHVIAGYLDAPQEPVIRMTVVRGVPPSIALPWSRVARAGQVPVAEAVRTGHPVWISGQEDLTRRFPRTALSFPYPVAMYVAPLVDEGVSWGAMLLLWPGTRSPEFSADEERIVEDACGRVARALKRAAEAGNPLLPRSEPLALEPPPRLDDQLTRVVDRFPWGVFALDLHGRLTYINDKACELLNAGPAELINRNPVAVLSWLNDPAFENAYLSALFSRLPSAFTVRPPRGPWLTITLYADDSGITVRVLPADLPPESPEVSGIPTSRTGMRAGTLFHLLHLASALTEANTVKEVTSSLSNQMMPVLGAQGFALLVSREGRLRVIGSRGFSSRMPEYFDGLPMTARTEAVRTIDSGTAAFYSDSATLQRSYPAIDPYGAMASFAYLPLTVSGRTIGCCVLGYDRSRVFTHEERAELVSLAGVIAQALERARLYDLNAGAARGLQAGLLPHELPQIAGLHTEARYRPAMHVLDVGGDFYDLIRLDDSTAAAVIGDVQGHNVQAAALMGQIRTAVHTHAQVGAPPAEVLARTNALLRDLHTELFASCAYVQIDLRRKIATLSMAGHPPPILRRPDGCTEVLDVPPGLLLGVEADTTFRTTEIDMPSGSLLALYTDGLVERTGIHLGDSIDDLAARIAKMRPRPLASLCDELIRKAEETVTEENSDDIALLLLETADHD